MARLDMSRFKESERLRYSVHEKVYAEYVVFEKDGQKFVQLDTFGKDDREIPEKVSQSIQFDIESAKAVVELLLKEYDFSLKLGVR